MRSYETIEVITGAFAKADSVGKFEVYVNENYIYFNRKHYSVTEIIHTAENTIYKTECLRHNGKRHIKYETYFAVSDTSIGYTEILSIESI